MIVQPSLKRGGTLLVGSPRHEDGGGGSRPPLHPASTRRLDAVQLTPHRLHRFVLYDLSGQEQLDLNKCEVDC